MRIFKCEKGFSLIEMMIVVVIIGILAAIAIPQFTALKQQATMSYNDAKEDLETTINVLKEEAENKSFSYDSSNNTIEIYDKTSQNGVGVKEPVVVEKDIVNSNGTISYR